MAGNVILLPVVTALDIPAQRVLDAAIAAGLKRVVVVGELDDGEEYFASSVADGPEVLWALERAKLRLMRVVDGES